MNLLDMVSVCLDEGYTVEYTTIVGQIAISKPRLSKSEFMAMRDHHNFPVENKQIRFVLNANQAYRFVVFPTA